RLGHVNKVKCYPIEYTELKRIEKSKYDFVATDLDKEDFKDYTLATIKVHYYRTKDEFASFVNKISLPKSFKRDKLFNRTDVINITGVNTKEDLQFIIESIVLNEYSNVTSFLEEVNNRAKIINPIRKNQIAILKSNNDILKKTFLKILVCDKPIEWDNEVCSIIIIYNVKDNDLTILQYINRFIANVLHKDELICSENSTENYNAFCKYFNE
ncbi:MAG: hypothetical protein K0R09_3736, partial [Clostridiales bacterium]|nr:hypothetical protein [Clostridiales bacterium]